MKVIRLHASGDMRLHDEPVPTPGEGEALLRVTAIGVCGSDLHWFKESGIGDARLTHPLVLGHEFAAVIQDGERKGQRVAVDPAIPCEVCEFCKEGNPNFCTALRFAGHSDTDGALREVMTWPRRCLHTLPDSMSDDDGAMLEPLGVALHAIDLAHLRPGLTVGVYGCGPIGLLVVQLARASGATRIIATDKLPHRVEAARSCGAAVTFQSQGGTETPEIWAATDQRGVDVAFEVAGENDAVETAIETAKPGGKVILVGIPSVDRTEFTASTARRKGLTIKLSRRMKLTYPRAIRLVERGIVDVRSLVTAQYPLDQFKEAFSAADRREGHKIVIHP